VGVVRYIPLPDDPGAAEVATEVDDEWHGRGIGRRRMSELAERARAQGMMRLVARVRADDYPVLGWIARIRGLTHGYAAEATVYTIPPERFAPERRAA
jgi:GNAT superfamily N-acetyltransferase